MPKYKIFLCLSFLTVWVWAAINPVYPKDWMLENYLTFIFVPLILLSGRYFKFSNLAYTLITLHLILHTIGSHYTYGQVPFGFTLQEWFDTSRNMYDRLVHFSFGLLWAYPMREVFIRLTQAKGFWSYYIPVDLTLAFSAFYEILEWIAVKIVDPGLGIAFLAAQGDVWDAQKDMALAASGAVIAMFVILLINWRLNPDFKPDFKASFKIPKSSNLTGIEKLKELLKK